MADQLEKVESSRQQFVSNVSHELKTPLSSVKVLSESILLQEDVPKEMYVEFLHDITSEVDRMTAIINDLLTLVKLDQKEIPLNFKETNLTQMMTDIIKRLQPMADAKHISLQWDASKEIHAEAEIDKAILADAEVTRRSKLQNQITQIITFLQLLLRDDKLSATQESELDSTLSELYSDFGITHDNLSLYDANGKIKTMPTIQDLYDRCKKNPKL